ncbi:MAG: ABC transporter substrate-binding protein [Lachnospiraceae bacterium]|nr:ABC transporter substrate-binding protein [Lachnospiraceae bacterium]
MKKKLLTVLCVLTMGVGLLSGCGGKEAAAVTTDRSGNEITVPANVEKIVSMAPSTTQLLIDMGLSDKIIAVDTYSYMSYGASLAADIPQFDMMSPDNEQIAALSPDIVFTTGMSYAGGDDVYAGARAAGICVADIPTAASIEDIYADIEFIGGCVGTEKEAKTIIDDMKSEIEEVKKIAEDIPEDQKKTVLYELSTPTPDFPDVYTCGAGTYINEIIEYVGAVNVAGNEEYQWPALSEETAIAYDPDVIITGDTYTPDVVNVILNTSGWENVAAVKNGEVYAIDGDALNRPNQHITESMWEIAGYIYPEYFDEVDEAA